MYPSRYKHGCMEIEIEIYEAPSGKRPFKIWFESIRDALTKAKVVSRLDRLKQGNFGDCKNVGSGVCELRIHYAQESGFITPRLVASLLSCYVGEIKARKIKTSILQRSI